MKRYFIVDEYFGSRVYDSINKTEEYYDIKETEKIIPFPSFSTQKNYAILKFL